MLLIIYKKKPKSKWGKGIKEGLPVLINYRKRIRILD
jgi:hypothetical protein